MIAPDSRGVFLSSTSFFHIKKNHILKDCEEQNESAKIDIEYIFSFLMVVY
jgi:hypothetical protein